ncbi:MAG: protein kinase [Gemmataceae bacterium]
METSSSQTAAFQLVPPEQLLKSIADLGLVPAAELQGFVNAQPAERRNDTKQLAQELMRQNLLTRFQATMLCQGKTRGLVLGNYLLTDKLGEGGMGLVYKAVHRRMKRVVALKVLSPAFTRDQGMLERFQREVEAAARLVHPNIVAAYDADEAQQTHFLVMEFVPGQDLSSYVRAKGALPVADAVACIVQAGRGLAHAHQAGVIHRDIKPHNLLRTTDAAGQLLVKVLDMGLARFEGGANAGPAKDLTDSGSIMGTCDYIAPEQAINTKRADHRADIYSLGCTLYYLLTAQPMFGGETAMEKFLAHQNEPIPPLRVVRPDVPEPLEATYTRMVAKKVEDRYQSMTDVLADLEKCPLPAGAAPDLATGLTAQRPVAPALPSGLEPTSLGGSPRASNPALAETSPSLSEGTRTFFKDRLADPSKRRRLLLAGGVGVAAALLLSFLVLGGRDRTETPNTPKGTVNPVAAGKTVKVFVLAGQSNMSGRAHIRTLKSLADQPATRPLLAEIQNPDGTWKVRDDVFIYSDVYDVRRARGKLTVGFGHAEDEFGPELLFGTVMGNHFEEPVLLIKLTKGAMSLAVEARPPSSGGNTGIYYRQLTATIKEVLADPGKEIPELKGARCELVGFVWFQGWNDNSKEANRNEYEENLTNFIKDVRTDLRAPNLPFVIGEFGVLGANAKPRALAFRAVQQAVADRPEFKGNVVLVKTADFWDQEADDLQEKGFKNGQWIDKQAEQQFGRIASNLGFLYLGSGKTFAQIGNAFGEGMEQLLR